jgi:Xaa-Pro dipeptidase
VSELPRFFDVNVGPKTTLYILNKEQQPDIQRHFGGSSSPAGHIDSTSLIRAMDRARVIKTPHEIALIRKANDVSSASHTDVAQYVLGLRNEEEVEAIFNSGCVARGAHEMAYGTIAGSGPNAAVLHYFANNEPLAGRQLMVLDAGCEWDCYASDITRTLPLNGEFSPEADAIHRIVQRMQEECIAMVAPGVGYRAIHRHAALVAAEGLLELGILTGDEDLVKSSGVAGAFFPHGLGHHVGLETHDVAGDDRLMSAARLEGGKRAMVTPRDMAQLLTQSDDDGQLLQPNMIVTIEPGM